MNLLLKIYLKLQLQQHADQSQVFYLILYFILRPIGFSLKF
jgi:hypothetical protein